ncbi:hypothetical protein ACA910_017486 [Epithemia clementina (nom. ined.)]
MANQGLKLRKTDLTVLASFAIGMVFLVTFGNAPESLSFGTFVPEGALIPNNDVQVQPMENMEASSPVVPPGSRRKIMSTSIVSEIGESSSSFLKHMAVPPIVASSSNLAWENDYNLVHVVNTRFMQHQASLTHLTSARMDLMKTFTVPSMAQQSNQQFMWLVWTDDDLPASFKQELVKEVSKIPGALVLAGEALKDTTLRSRYGYITWNDLSKAVVWGDRQLLWTYYQASQSHILLETDLDADDALSKTFVESVQAEAAYNVGQDTNKFSESIEIYCPESHVEWRFFNNETGLDKLSTLSNAGQFVHYHNPSFCIKSGVTRVYHLVSDKKPHSRELGPTCHLGTELPGCCQRSLFEEMVMQYKNGGNRRELPQEGSCTASSTPLGTQHAAHENANANMCQVGKLCRGSSNFAGGNSPQYFHKDDFSGLETKQLECIVDDCGEEILFEVEILAEIQAGQGRTSEYFPTDVRITYKPTGNPAKYYEMVAVNVVDRGQGQERPFNRFGWKDPLSTTEFTHGAYTDTFNVETGFTLLYLCVQPQQDPACRRQLRVFPEDEEKFEYDASESTSNIKSLDASVLLTRTPTAAGMKNVMPGTSGGGANSIPLNTYRDSHVVQNKPMLSLKKKQAVASTPRQDQAWVDMEAKFGIQKQDVEDLYHRFNDDMENILVDAFSGQCTPGHSCKEASKRALGNLLDKKRLRHKN